MAEAKLDLLPGDKLVGTAETGPLIRTRLISPTHRHAGKSYPAASPENPVVLDVHPTTYAIMRGQGVLLDTTPSDG